MAKKEKEKTPIENREVSIQNVYANDVGIGYDVEVALNFALVTPSVFAPHKDEYTPVVRVILTWEVAESLSKGLQSTIRSHNRAIKQERKAKSKE